MVTGERHNEQSGDLEAGEGAHVTARSSECITLFVLSVVSQHQDDNSSKRGPYIFSHNWTWVNVVMTHNLRSNYPALYEQLKHWVWAIRLGTPMGRKPLGAEGVSSRWHPLCSTYGLTAELQHHAHTVAFFYHPHHTKSITNQMTISLFLCCSKRFCWHV